MAIRHRWRTGPGQGLRYETPPDIDGHREGDAIDSDFFPRLWEG